MQASHCLLTSHILQTTLCCKARNCKCLAFRLDLNRPSTARSFGSSFFLGGIVLVAPKQYFVADCQGQMRTSSSDVALTKTTGATLQAVNLALLVAVGCNSNTMQMPPGLGY